MQQYEASTIFLRTAKQHPSDFTVLFESRRDSEVYIIRHLKSNVCVVLDVSNTSKTIAVGTAVDSLKYIQPSILNDLLQFAEKRLQDQKIQDNVEKDNSAIRCLLSYYSN